MAPPTRLRVGLALMAEPAFARAAEPLLGSGAVEVVEWSFDTCWRDADRPAWLRVTLDDFARRGALIGHGVTFNPLGGDAEPLQERWLDRCRAECTRLRYQRVSEHFGVLRTRGFIDGTPLPPPPTAATIRVGRDRLLRMADACGAQIGLENLATALGRADVEREGELLDALLEPVAGFLVLDVHNLWCRSLNFDIPFGTLLDRYPLQRVTELHVSGGSWSEALGARVRRDTHDDAVPDELLTHLGTALTRCPNADAVVLERLGSSLCPADGAAQLRFDFERVQAVCAAATRT